MKTLLVLVVLALSVLIVQAANLKKTYCGNQEFLGNVPATNYPHLHCGKDFITLSMGSNNHFNFFDKNGKVKCNPIWNMVVSNPGSYSAAKHASLITTAVSKFYKDFCRKGILQRLVQLLLQNLE